MDRVDGSGLRAAIAVSGGISLFFGLLAIVWPSKTALALTAIVAVYAALSGLAYAVLGGIAKQEPGSRAVNIVVGSLLLIGSVIALLTLTATSDWARIVVSLVLGAIWVVEGIAGLSTLPSRSSKAASVAFAMLSIVAGVLVLFSLLLDATAAWWLISVSLVVLGSAQIVRAVTLR